MAGDAENVITVEPVGNRMVHGLLALEGGDAGGASHELPNNGALTTARGDGSDCHERHAESSEEPSGRQNRAAQGELLGSDAENPGNDGGRAETSGRPSVESPEEESIDEASLQAELTA